VAELSERYGEKHPSMIAAKSDLVEARRHIKEEVGKVVEGIRKEYEVALENEQKLTSLSERHNSEIRDLRGKEFELAKLEREAEANRHLYEIFLTRFKETNLTEDSKVTNIQVVDKAKPPLSSFKPRKKRIVAGFVLAGLFLGVGLAFLRENLDSTFRNHEDVERGLSLPVLEKPWRWIVGLVLLPYSIIWAFLFSVFVRNLAMALPFLGAATGLA